MSKPNRSRSPFRAWALILVGLFVFVTLVVGLPYLIVGDAVRRPNVQRFPTSLDLPPGVRLDDLQQVEVEDVVDGDTIDVLVGRRSVRIRYYGVDTPERGNVCFREAQDRNGLLAGSKIWLLPGPRDSDQFGRLLRYVFTAEGISIDATLVAEGLGVAWQSDGQYRDQIVELEAGARAAGRGCLWE